MSHGSVFNINFVGISYWLILMKFMNLIPVDASWAAVISREENFIYFLEVFLQITCGIIDLVVLHVLTYSMIEQRN